MSIEIRKGSRKDAEPLLRLLQQIREMLADGRMLLWTAMDGRCLAGAYTVVIPGLGEDNYGYDLGLTEGELPRVVNMDTAAVHPSYRGQGLQERLMQAVEERRSPGWGIVFCCVPFTRRTGSAFKMS